MSIKAKFRTGEKAITVTSLYQWDYGQKLEIESADLPPLIEVHFACSGMNEAVVHSCSVDDGIAIVDIPNRCLEQTSAVTAWVYEIDETQGRTTKIITIPIVARIRPSRSEEIPQEIADCYTELIAEVRAVIEDLKSGGITVAQAQNANNANYAATAGNATTANYAVTAGSIGGSSN